MRCWWLPALLLGACEAEDAAGGDCLPPGDDAVFQFAPEVSEGQMAMDADIAYGTPPQGGAPYAPFEVRALSDIDVSERFEIVASAVDRDSGEEIGSVSQSQAFLCANAGPLEGWRFGGEVHVRFWGIDNADLEGREVDVTMTIGLPEGEVVAEGGGTLVWTIR